MLSRLLCVCVFLVVLSAPSLGRGGGRGGGGRGGGSRGGGGHRSSGGGYHSSGGTYHSSGGHQSHSYPSSNGLSGTGAHHTYPSSGGYSGYGRLSKPPAYGGSSHPSQVYHPSGGGGYHPSAHYTPTYYHAPQTVYITQYRQSDSSYSNLLTGLALYNMGRSHHHDHYYYHDTYSRNRYTDSYTKPTKLEDEAECSLRVEETGKMSHLLRIPCEIVSTFAPAANATAPVSNATATDVIANCTTLYRTELVVSRVASGQLVNGTIVNGTLVGGTLVNGKLFDGTSVNCTAVNTTTAAVDPLKLNGPKVSVTADMRCAVEVRTRLMSTSKDVDCAELIRYSKMPEPKPESELVPSRDSYRSWLKNPPWWLSIFFVV